MKLKFQVVFFTLLLGLAGCNGDDPTTTSPAVEKPATEKLANQVEPPDHEPTETTEDQDLEIDDIIDIPDEEFVEETPEMSSEEEEIPEMSPEEEEIPEMNPEEGDEVTGEDEEVLSDDDSE